MQLDALEALRAVRVSLGQGYELPLRPARLPSVMVWQIQLWVHVMDNPACAATGVIQMLRLRQAMRVEKSLQSIASLGLHGTSLI